MQFFHRYRPIARGRRALPKCAAARRPAATLEHHPAFPTLRRSGAAPSAICRLLTRGFINPGVAKKKAHQRCCNTPSRRRPSTTTTTTDDRRRRHPPPFFFSFSSDRSLPCAICPLRSHIPRSRHPRRRASPPRRRRTRQEQRDLCCRAGAGHLPTHLRWFGYKFSLICCGELTRTLPARWARWA